MWFYIEKFLFCWCMPMPNMVFISFYTFVHNLGTFPPNVQKGIWQLASPKALVRSCRLKFHHQTRRTICRLMIKWYCSWTLLWKYCQWQKLNVFVLFSLQFTTKKINRWLQFWVYQLARYWLQFSCLLWRQHGSCTTIKCGDGEFWQPTTRSLRFSKHSPELYNTQIPCQETMSPFGMYIFKQVEPVL